MADANAPESSSGNACTIHQWIRSLEAEPKMRPLANYMETVQTDINAEHRGIVVNWLVRVADRFCYASNTLYLTISYIDRFLSLKDINKSRLPLLGVSSMLIASKHEEIIPEHPELFCWITENSYTRQEVKQMEKDILKLLDINMSNLTIKKFLWRYIVAGQGDGVAINRLKFLVDYIAELSLLDYDCIQFLPSLIASAAVFLARFTINPSTQPWTPKLQEKTGYRQSEIMECVKALHDLQLKKKMPSLTGSQIKFSQDMYMCVSALVPPSKIPTSYFSDGTDGSSTGDH